MKSKTTLNSVLLLILSIICIIIAGNIAPKVEPQISIKAQERSITLKKEFLQVFNLGISKVISSYAWIQTMLDSDLEHYQQDDLKSWMYLRFDLITELDPYFKFAYEVGGQYLSVIKDDDTGAEKILLKGLDLFPDDVRLNYFLGSHYLIELKDYDQAIKYYQRILNNPKAPEYAKSVLAKMLNTRGDFESSLAVVRKLHADAPDNSQLKERYLNIMKSIVIEIDLECLNQNRTTCNQIDPYGKEYIQSNRGYKSLSSWKSYKIKKAAQ